MAEKIAGLMKVSDNVWSTAETLIGTYDGKNHYRKIYKVTNVAPNGTTTINTGITGVDHFTRIGGIGVEPSGWEVPIPYINGTAAYIIMCDYDNVNNRFRVIRYNPNGATMTVYFTAEYTKV